jgi:RNA polymerase sigma-70 factor (ECF subfamily)
MAKIQQLPDGYRVIFNMYAIEGFNHREIGERMSISEGTSKSQFSRARKQLQEMIERDNEVELIRLKDAR